MNGQQFLLHFNPRDSENKIVSNSTTASGGWELEERDPVPDGMLCNENSTYTLFFVWSRKMIRVFFKTSLIVCFQNRHPDSPLRAIMLDPKPYHIFQFSLLDAKCPLHLY
eukprot:TRINITY_DN3259_c0_g1_i2.p1 TRINITY_DN3259_c0_g1~~TRINITY_DN3259_c0_g1_i2.p1  ORF type:complete len:110 (+),score=14.65 TRINITY_DN3259_c0_g1_i2:480-809(+)